MKILDEYGIEVAILSIANPTFTSYVVISREAERFVNEIHDHNEELRSSNELLTELEGSVKSEPFVKKEKEVRVTRKLVPTLSAVRLEEHPCTHKEPFRQIRGNGRSFTQLHQMEDTLETAVSKMVTQKCCVILVKKKDKLMVQDIGIP